MAHDENELSFNAREFLAMPGDKQIRICRALAARARDIADLGPMEHALHLVRIALGWDQLANAMEESSGRGMSRATTDHVDVIFGGPPSPDGPCFIEGKDEQGRNIKLEWFKREDGTWALRIRPEA